MRNTIRNITSKAVLMQNWKTLCNLLGNIYNMTKKT